MWDKYQNLQLHLPELFDGNYSVVDDEQPFWMFPFICAAPNVIYGVES